MTKSDFDRRKFHRLAAAALGGMASGSLIGCSQKPAPAPVAQSGGKATPAEPAEAEEPDATAKDAPHVCRGLNACKGQGAGGDNACAGQGACATAEAHDCRGQNACKNQGGCGETPSENACKGMGECAVPLMDDAWTKARARFTARMEEQGKKVGAAPEA